MLGMVSGWVAFQAPALLLSPTRGVANNADAVARQAMCVALGALQLFGAMFYLFGDVCGPLKV